MAAGKLGGWFFSFVDKIGADLFARLFWGAIILSVIALIAYCHFSIAFALDGKARANHSLF